MNRSHIVIIWIFIIIAILIAGISLHISLCDKYWPNLDANTFLVSVLAVLVTILLGWNIYTIIDTKGKISQMRETAKQEVDTAIEKVNHSVNAYIAYVNVIDEIKRKRKGYALKETINVLKEGILGSNYYPLDKVLDFLTEVSKEERQTDLCHFSKEEKREFYKVLFQIKHRDVEHIIKMIENARE